MKSPENIQELIQLLSETTKSHYNSILNNFDFNTIEFQDFESWSSKKYTRNCLYKDSQFELLLLCWNEGQETSIHGHDGEDCWVYLLHGEMEEVFYSLDDSNYLVEERSQNILPQQLSFMNDRIGFHKLRNRFNGKSMSLHLYAKPIEQCRFYCETSEQFIEKKLKYDTHKELIFGVTCKLI
ncbi:cysteine dioxygenase [Psychroserpens ponticola]|uniref:Cysteine dioxygenase family protein n=1 Tax=Psychroserpens ponticola TaxID=2932268 RepID=A0ABY7RVF8_9FLAO|nr:cysteine dioxygenase family protein [Psychroserpens ponticola]WCO01102.1 cysteine dioxygenase family protein [Psychroserpens ponticola]